MLTPISDKGWEKANQAVARFESLGWPTTKREEWKYFSTRALEHFKLSEAPTGKMIELPDLPERRIVFVDGRFMPHLLDLGDDAGLSIRALSDYVDDEHLSLMNHLTPEDGALEYANYAWLTDGLHLVIEGKVPLFHIVHITTGQGVVHHRSLIELKRHAETSILAHYIGKSDEETLANIVTELELGDNAQLNYAKCLDESPTGSHIEAFYSRQGRDSRLASFTLSLGADKGRTSLVADLNGEGATCQIDGLYMAEGKSVLDHFSHIRHVKGHTESQETWAGILDDKSVGTFQGRVTMLHGAVKSNTDQMTRTLLLSKDARANAKPELRIDCDDVTATHGATIGQLDPLQLFYLESRGIPPELARHYLIMSFAKNVLALAPEPLRDELLMLASRRFGEEEEPFDDEF